MAVTLDKLSFADGTALASTCMPTVRRQPMADTSPVAPSSVVGGCALVTPVAGGPGGEMTKPVGRRGMKDGSSPLIATWTASTSIVAYTTRLPPDGWVLLSCSRSSTFWDELLAA